jgi:glutamate/tyrosine decarboxylase-like PLP-dependent enzyme
MTDVDRFRDLAHRAADLAADHMESVERGPVFRPMTPEERRALLELPLPERGQSPDAALEFARTKILTHPMGNGHPRFFGWVNSPPAPEAVAAEFLAAALNPSVAGGDHAAVYLEHGVVRWLMELIGFPSAGSMGMLVSGGSVASLVGLAAARHKAALADGWSVREEGLQGGRPRLVLYVTDEGHSALRKAAEILGLGSASVRTVATDSELRMDVQALRTGIEADRVAGRRPFCVAASAGTVNSGAIDPLADIADLCAAERLWLHVDGAYGAFGAVAPSLTPLYEGVARADSVALDPHKWLSVPIECGCAVVRDGALLRDAFSLVPPYLRTEEGKGFGGLPWFSEYGPQQTRGFRALKLWMAILSIGRAGLAARIERHVALARRLGSRIEEADDFERLAQGPLSIVCFRYAPAALRGQDERLDRLNKAVMERVQAGGEAFLSGTIVRGRFALRACVLHDRTSQADVDALVEITRRAGVECARSS